MPFQHSLGFLLAANQAPTLSTSGRPFGLEVGSNSEEVLSGFPSRPIIRVFAFRLTSVRFIHPSWCSFQADDRPALGEGGSSLSHVLRAPVVKSVFKVRRTSFGSSHRIYTESSPKCRTLRFRLLAALVAQCIALEPWQSGVR